MKAEIEGMLINIYMTIGIDRPENHDNILDFIVNDVQETADPENWHSGDVAIAFRRWIEAQATENVRVSAEDFVSIAEADIDKQNVRPAPMSEPRSADNAEAQALNIPVVSVPLHVIKQVLKYCEDNQIYDKLGSYQNFYYKLNQIRRECE